MKILHPTDFSGTADKARALAVDLAERLAGTLHIVHVQREFESRASRAYLQPSIDHMNPELLRQMQAHREQEVAQLKNRLAAFAREAGSTATSDLLWGEPLPELMAAAEDADLVAMGAHGDNPFDIYFLGGLAGRFVRRASTPVLTVRNETPTARARRILVATDFGPSSRAAWEFCKRLRTEAAGGLDLVIAHVIEDERLAAEAGYTEAATKAMSDMAGDDAERHLLRSGQPVEVLPELSSEVGADIIALGVRRHAGALGLVLGSRTDALLRSSPIPILSVPAS